MEFAETIPVRGPVHKKVGANERGRNVEDLAADAPECVEDSVMDGAGKGVLAVRADSICDDALLLHATCQTAKVRTCRPSMSFTIQSSLASAPFALRNSAYRCGWCVISRVMSLTQVAPASNVPAGEEASVTHFKAAAVSTVTSCALNRRGKDACRDNLINGN